MRSSEVKNMRILLLTFFFLAEFAGSVAQNVPGIDVSQYDGAIDWPKVKNAGISFAFARASDGSSASDDTFQTNITQGTAAGVIMGAYHFASPGNGNATTQANYFLSVASHYIGKGFLPPVLDLEITNGLTESELNNWALEWLMEVQKQTGIKPIIYASTDFAYSSLNGANSPASVYDLWVASWDISNPGNVSPWTSWLFWQYSDTGSIPGISDAVDLDVFEGDSIALSQLVNDIPIDTLSPDFVSGYPQATQVFANNASFAAEVDELSTVYCVVLPDGSTPPSTQQVKAGKNASGNPAVNGNFIALPLKPGSVTISGLISNTTYNVYFVAQDAYGNLQSVTTRVDITTTPNQTITGLNEPAISGVSIYPNPAGNFVVVSLENAGTDESVLVNVHDLLDRNLTTIEHIGGDPFSLDLSSYAQGIYIVTVQQLDNVFNVRLVKQ
jgi:GH25 family lysozyme M1 (1,4-beta-N-acetylmuramidase)